MSVMSEKKDETVEKKDENSEIKTSKNNMKIDMFL